MMLTEKVERKPNDVSPILKVTMELIVPGRKESYNIKSEFKPDEIAAATVAAAAELSAQVDYLAELSHFMYGELRKAADADAPTEEPTT